MPASLLFSFQLRYLIYHISFITSDKKGKNITQVSRQTAETNRAQRSDPPPSYTKIHPYFFLLSPPSPAPFVPSPSFSPREVLVSVRGVIPVIATIAGIRLRAARRAPGHEGLVFQWSVPGTCTRYSISGFGGFGKVQDAEVKDSGV